jgi:acetyltransferase-like isoleucine patch superfamily enzyme
LEYTVIGRNTVISFDVFITDNDHTYEQIDVPVMQQRLIVKKTIIGENCFIASDVKILAGTVLGKQCIVGSNSVVRGEFPDYCVIVGSPARVVKRYSVQSGCWERVPPLETSTN